ncbi:MAG: FIST C-terminal domain-containing protein [Oligoflexales bacterium]|nr:FIST C-terminal domain-containing protein [Oligoflexales bacterium]
MIVISDGLKVNGSELVKGIQSGLGKAVPLSGGLAGDRDRFTETYVYANGNAKSGQLALIGLYGDLDIGHGSVGGWDEFGPVRTISASNGNVLEKIDDESALDLYKKYLGDEHSQKLPGSALLFPILVYPEGKKDEALVRTVLAVDEDKKTMTFAGDVPTGYCAQLMRANFDHIIDAAGEAAGIAKVDTGGRASFALLISCVGRKMILGQRTADEIESVQEKLGENTHQLGFYSYGEISPIVNIKDSCALHNQTMTITVISEKKAS